MEVEIRLSEQCPSPKIVIVTSHMTEELEALVRLLQQDQIRSIPGFQGSHIVPLEPRDILRLCASRGKVLAVLAGGPIGVFTVVAAFMTGPLITAWNRVATLRLYRRFHVLDREELAEERG